MDKNRNSKIASKVNAQNQKQCNSTQDMAKQRISEFEGISMETSKTKICKEKKGTEYSQTVGQLQNVLT